MAQPPAGQSCATCRFYHGFPIPQPAGDSDWTGHCRRYPRTVFHGDDEYGDLYPLTTADDWCGEFQPDRPDTFSDAATTLARSVLLGDKTAAYALVDRLTEDRGTDPRTEGG